MLSSNFRRGLLMVTTIALASLPALAVTPVVKTVPWDPANFASPHTTFPTATIILGATVDTLGSADSFTFKWDFGDGNVTAAAPVTNPYDISASHAYAGSTAGQTWTAKVTVTDTTTSTSATANYPVIMQNNTLTSRVNVAIDKGLWYMHQTEWRATTTVGSNTVNWGGWDYRSGSPGCPTVGGSHFDCDDYYESGAIDATNVQAFEVSGHFGNGPPGDPFTDDVARGTARMFYFLAPSSIVAKAYDYNPATADYGCSTGFPTPAFPTCQSPATQVFYNPGSTSCTSPPCSFSFDGNSNGQNLYVANGAGYPLYEGGQFMDAIVATGTPNATAAAGSAGIVGMTYKNIIQDMVDYQAYCQYGSDTDVSQGYTRGAAASQGGGWWYGCLQGDDNSVSQWAAIGLIGAARGFNILTPPIVKDANQVWVTNSQDVQQSAPTGPDPYLSNDNLGSFGYNGSLYYSNAWGPFAVTPSGMVQMALDGVGRTKNTALGDTTMDPDQRFNNAETYYADNFCNDTVNGAYYAPRGYTYGMFSFTKSMLLHNPNGTLTPIQFMRTQTPNVFTTNPSIPHGQIDWYAALSPANGGSDPCDGVAQTIVARQSPDGHWFGYNYNQGQFYYETGWSIIMLRKTVFVTCVSNLAGKGTRSSGNTAARIDLTWAAQQNATSYNILRSTTNGGPYTQVGTSSGSSFSDRTGLTNGHTYYYVIQPVNGTSEICQSNQATIAIPAGR